MNERTKLGLGVLEAALLVGLLGDALLRATPWGLNVFLWMGAFLAAMTALARQKRIPLRGDGQWLLPSALLFAAAFTWRDSLTLRFLDALAILCVLSLAVLRSRGGRIRLAGVTEYTLGVIAAGFNAAVGILPLLFADIHWKEIPSAGWSRRALAVARGLIIALPLLAIFGALFMSADAIFEGIVRETFHLNFETLLTHLFLTLFFAWITGGFLRGMLLGNGRATPGEGQHAFVAFGLTTTEKDGSSPRAAFKSLSLGIVEISIVLGLLNLLFFCFVSVQLRYFFGGARWVMTSAGLTYAEYARRGFFELVTVAALVLPILLAAHWLFARRENPPAHELAFRALAGAQVFLLFIIMASAFGRMRLYQSEYGLTELRLYTTAFMVWLGVVFIWFAATVLRGRREQFACGALIAGFVLIGLLHLLNPDAFIVRTNVAQMNAGRAFDAEYAVSLSADAVPALVKALPEMNAGARSRVVQRIIERWLPDERPDWRSWNWSRAEARRKAETLREIGSEVKEARPAFPGVEAPVRDREHLFAVESSTRTVETDR
jgi:hypothetical protein